MFFKPGYYSAQLVYFFQLKPFFFNFRKVFITKINKRWL